MQSTVTPVLIVGMGRSGTTVLAHVLGHCPDLLHVEEPNFVTSLIIPYLEGGISGKQLLEGVEKEGWRGPMKFCRTMAGMYPVLFDDSGAYPIRPLIKERFTGLVEACDGKPLGYRRELVQNVLHEIVQSTCQWTETRRWLVKQPNAVLYCRQLVRFWPDIKVIHVARHLAHVLLSRVVRAYQPTFEKALAVCEERLAAATRLEEVVGHKSVIHVSIEELAGSPESSVMEVTRFLGIDANEQVIRAARTINRTELDRLGKPQSFFTIPQMEEIRAMRGKYNSLFGRTLV